MAALDEFANLGKILSSLNSGWGSGLKTYYDSANNEQKLSDNELKYQQALDVFRAMQDNDYNNRRYAALGSDEDLRQGQNQYKLQDLYPFINPNAIDFRRQQQDAGVEINSPEYYDALQAFLTKQGVPKAADNTALAAQQKRNQLDEELGAQQLDNASVQGAIALLRSQNPGVDITDIHYDADGKVYAIIGQPDETGLYDEDQFKPIEQLKNGREALRTLSEGDLTISEPAIIKDAVSAAGIGIKQQADATKRDIAGQNNETKIRLAAEKLNQMTPAQRANTITNAAREYRLAQKDQKSFINNIAKEMSGDPSVIAMTPEQRSAELNRRVQQRYDLVKSYLVADGKLSNAGEIAAPTVDDAALPSLGQSLTGNIVPTPQGQPQVNNVEDFRNLVANTPMGNIPSPFGEDISGTGQMLPGIGGIPSPFLPQPQSWVSPQQRQQDLQQSRYNNQRLAAIKNWLAAQQRAGR